MGTALVRSPSVLWRLLHDRVLVLPSGGDLLTLTGTAPGVWAELSAPVTFEALCQKLAEHYDTQPARIAPDVQHLVDQLVRVDAILEGPR